MGTDPTVIYIGIAVLIIVMLMPKRFLQNSSKVVDKAVLKFRERVFR